MGGGGGFFGGVTKPEELFNKVRDSEAKTSDETFESNVSEEIASLLAKYNQRSEAVKQHLAEIIKALGKDIEGSIELLFGGSVAKHTYVDGLSDVDALMLLNKSELKNKSPEEVKGYFLDTINKRLPKTPIEKGTLAVTVDFSDVKVQLLPAIRYKGGFRISDSSGRSWSFIKPEEFAKRLTEVNKKTGGKLVPTIKLAKSINSCQAKNRQLESHHIEALALKVFKGYTGKNQSKDMLKHFFCNAPRYVHKPMADITGQSSYVDNYLGNAGSLNRKLVSDTLSRIGRRMSNADRAHSQKLWEQILEGL